MNEYMLSSLLSLFFTANFAVLDVVVMIKKSDRSLCDFRTLVK